MKFEGNDMKPIQQSFEVKFEYQVHFTNNLFHQSNQILINTLLQGKNYSEGTQPKVAFVIDQGVSGHHPDLADQIQNYFLPYHKEYSLVSQFLNVIGGEETKNSKKEFEKVLEFISDQKIDRHSYLIAIGGGAVLDMVGYAAAVGHRGIRHIRIPTTVLSQNDSGVGVKNGVNYFGKKNFLGSFAPPFAVLNDVQFLTTLDERDWRSGISEAIKVALIKDLPFFEWIEDNTVALNQRVLDTMQNLIYRCADYHVRHIGGAGDPFEKGSSRPLDFGHWAAHKLEQLTNYQLRHGEAVAIGIALDVTYSYLNQMIDESAWQRVINLILNLNFEVFNNKLLDNSQQKVNPELLKGLEEFREHLGGQLTIMLLEKLGKGVEVHQMNLELVEQAALMLQNVAEKAVRF